MSAGGRLDPLSNCLIPKLMFVLNTKERNWCTQMENEQIMKVIAWQGQNLNINSNLFIMLDKLKCSFSRK